MSHGPHRQRSDPGLGRRAAFAVAACLCAGVTGCGSSEPATAARATVPTNITVMRSLVSGLGRQVLDSAGAALMDTVVLDVDSSTISWIARTELAALLGSAGKQVIAGRSASDPAARWNVRGLTLSVEYRNIRDEGMFSGSVVDRVVTAVFSSELTDTRRVVYAGTLTGSAIDTVAEDGIALLESESLAFTKGTVPDARSFDRFIEPFVIIGATAAAIFLFFQVRS